MQLYYIVYKIIFDALHLMLFVLLFYYLIENIIIFFANIDRITLEVLNDGLNALNETLEESVIDNRIIKYVDLPFEVLVFKNIL